MSREARAWGVRHGYKVATHGRIPKQVMEAYIAATKDTDDPDPEPVLVPTDATPVFRVG